MTSFAIEMRLSCNFVKFLNFSMCIAIRAFIVSRYYATVIISLGFSALRPL